MPLLLDVAVQSAQQLAPIRHFEWNVCPNEPNVVLRWIECHPGFVSLIQGVGTFLAILTAILVPAYIRYRVEHDTERKYFQRLLRNLEAVDSCCRHLADLIIADIRAHGQITENCRSRLKIAFADLQSSVVALRNQNDDQLLPQQLRQFVQTAMRTCFADMVPDYMKRIRDGIEMAGEDPNETVEICWHFASWAEGLRATFPDMARAEGIRRKIWRLIFHMKRYGVPINPFMWELWYKWAVNYHPLLAPILKWLKGRRSRAASRTNQRARVAHRLKPRADKTKSQ